MKRKTSLLAKAFACTMAAIMAWGGLLACSDGGDSGSEEPPSGKTYYTVTFDTDGGSEIKSQSVESGKLATKPGNPTRTGFEFLNWYYDGTVFSFLTPITKNITLTAKWKDPSKTYYTVTFKYDDELTDSQEVEAGQCVSEPTEPTKDGYDFTGWYTEDETEFDFETPITKDITLEAGWNKKSSTSGGGDDDDNTVTPGGSDVNGVQDALNDATISQGSIEILAASGWLNSAYVIFNQYDGATKYTVKVDGAPIDDELIRYYTTYTFNTYNESTGAWTEEKWNNVVRADALGLKKGSHTITVSANNTTSDSSATFNVIDQDRSGFAFAPSAATTPGAYKKDGTLKDKTIVLYVTAKTAKTVSYTAVKGTNATESKTYTGLQDVLSEKSLSKLTVPLDIRIIGTIRKDDLDRFDSSDQGLQIKTTSNNGVTVEGVGHDAAVYGFGFLIRDAHYVELSNLGVYNFMDDGISVDTKNDYLWIHNNDISYGAVGSDSDQAKGDGSLDFKKSYYSTLSYNHFWDSGKCNLLDASAGSGTSASNYLTYHHNWYDHSDSRHPRIRNASAVHVYNNYYDGNAKYGIGVTSGSSCFAEGNYFRDASDPMMSSKQGTDARGSGTFSGEEGGVIKAWNNKFVENNKYNNFQYITNKYDYTNGVEVVPPSTKTETVGTQNSDGTWTLYDVRCDANTDTIKTCGFIEIADASFSSGKYQTKSNKTGFKLKVPAGKITITVAAKCGTSKQSGTGNMLRIGSETFNLNMDSNASYVQYTATITVSAESTIEVKNVHSSNSMNVNAIKVIADKQWTTTYTVGTDLTDIDAYEVDSRKEQVPAVVKTKSGEHMYSNFDVELGDTGMGISIAPTAPDRAKEDVVKYAGRHNSDFAYTFNNATDDRDYAVNAALKALVVNYRSGLTKTQ